MAKKVKQLVLQSSMPNEYMDFYKSSNTTTIVNRLKNKSKTLKPLTQQLVNEDVEAVLLQNSENSENFQDIVEASRRRKEKLNLIQQSVEKKKNQFDCFEELCKSGKECFEEHSSAIRLWVALMKQHHPTEKQTNHRMSLAYVLN